jgi:two-component system, chemotaxis family, protein-glutamate methylesterase/glutaminase
MPVLNGIEALKIIMSETPVPVVMFSSTTQEGAENTLLAIQSGAVDFIAKPSGNILLCLEKMRTEIIAKVLSASKANIRRLGLNAHEANLFPTELPKCSKIELDGPIISAKSAISWESSAKKLICIGTSTGGPRALQTVLTKLPGDLKAPVLVVQHMPPGFTRSLANRLDALSNITVKEAENGEWLQAGTVYIAPGGYHMKVKEKSGKLMIALDQSEPRNGHRPAVNILFDSVGLLPGYAKIVVVMTGMGSDGSDGLIHMKQQATHMKVIAESEETAIVFGMPKAAISTHLVDEVQNLENIAKTILKYV